MNAKISASYCEPIRDLEYRMKYIHDIPEKWGPFAAKRDEMFTQYPAGTRLGDAIRAGYSYSEIGRYEWLCRQLQRTDIDVYGFEVRYLTKLGMVWHLKKQHAFSKNRTGANLSSKDSNKMLNGRKIMLESMPENFFPATLVKS